VDQPVCKRVNSGQGIVWAVEGQGVFVQHCQLWQALWMWQISLDTQQESNRMLDLQSSISNDSRVLGNTMPSP